MCGGPWFLVQHPDHWSKFFSIGLDQWLEWNLPQKDIGLTHWNRSLLFGVACWALYRDMNSQVFSQYSDIWGNLWPYVCNQVYVISNNLSKPQNSRSNFTKPAQSTWEKPVQGWFKLNVDGAFGSRQGNIACGGLIRDSNGAFVKGFYSKVTSSNAL